MDFSWHEVNKPHGGFTFIAITITKYIRTTLRTLYLDDLTLTRFEFGKSDKLIIVVKFLKFLYR